MSLALQQQRYANVQHEAAFGPHASYKMKVRLKKPFAVCCSHDLICFDVVEITSEYNALGFDWSETTIS